VRRLPRFLVLLALTLWASQHAKAMNSLAGNPSPYLAMHGEDPVAWHEWGPAALTEAQRSNRPIFISSGYFACHWCHVMQRESYRNPDIAALLNRHFVPVKLDRELHPALDEYLIGFVERTAGRAGWPLNVFLTPEGYPMLGLTYAPPGEFSSLLERVVRVWQAQEDQLRELARRAANERMAEQSERDDGPSAAIDAAELGRRLRAQALSFGDGTAGGFGDQSKFPMAPNLEALLSLQTREPDADLAELLTATLDAIMRLGLRDHLGGGFFRYTVDPDWHTPHFEKMLYNQALLVPLYLRAARVLDRPGYRAVARETLDFMAREFRGDGGGLISSLSALDDKDVEGGYYLWHPDELERLLTHEQRRLLGLMWRLDAQPRHEAGLLPMLGEDLNAAAGRLHIPPDAARRLFDDARSRLAEARAKRILPRDTKQLASWNGLALSAFAAGVRAFDAPEHRRTAERLRYFLVKRLWDGKALHRARSGDRWIGEATLEDYAYVARALHDWGKLTDSEEDLALSRRLIQIAWERFYREGGWVLTDTSLLPGIPTERAFADSPLPSPAAVLLGLTLAAEDPKLSSRAIETLPQSAETVLENPFTFAGHAALLVNSAP
jgi:uncharacterized protein YyaL (SSP411 family)